MTTHRFRPMDKVGIIGSKWLGPFLVKRYVHSIDGYLYDLSNIQDKAEPVWRISETALYRWPDIGGRPSWDKEAL